MTLHLKTESSKRIKNNPIFFRFSGLWDDYEFKQGMVFFPDGKSEEYVPGKNYLDIPKPEQFPSKIILFDWSKFKFEKARSLRINQKIVLQQQKYLEPLIEYGMITRTKEEDVANKSKVAETNYTPYPLVNKFVKSSSYNFDHLEKSNFFQLIFP